MAPEVAAIIGTVITGASGIILALSGYRRNRNAQLREDLRQCWHEHGQLRSKLYAALHHLGVLEECIANAGLKVPSRPKDLEPVLSVLEPSGSEPRRDTVSSPDGR